MARVIAQIDVDHRLEAQLRAWQGVPEVVRAWSSLNPAEREEFHLEWRGVTEAQLQQLGQLAAAGALTPAQRSRYQELQRLADAQRPAIDGLLDAGTA